MIHHLPERFTQCTLPSRRARLGLCEPGQFSEMVLEMVQETSELQPKCPLLSYAPFFPWF